MSPFEIGNCDRTETFLASGVPNLEFHLRVIQVQVLDFKVDADCRDERRRKTVICIPHEQARFTDTCVSEHQKFNVDIVRMLVGFSFVDRWLDSILNSLRIPMHFVKL